MSHRYLALDGWRGLAALAIAVYHAPIAHPLRAWDGWKNMEMFVDLFFVLSGFVIAHAWGSRIQTSASVRDFMNRRFWRVWPLHAVVLSAFIGLEMVKLAAGMVVPLPIEEAAFAGDRSIQAIVSNLLLIQSLNMHGTTTWNGPAWSISVEFWTYLIFAAVVLVFKARALWVYGAMVMIGCIGLAAFSPIGLFATHDFGMFRAIYGFFMGCTTFSILSRIQHREHYALMGEVGIIAVLGAFLAVTGTNASSLFAPLIFAGLVIVFSASKRPLTRWLETRPMQNLGLWSYSIYLIHTLLFYGLRLALNMVEKFLDIDLTSAGNGAEKVFTLGSSGADLVFLCAVLGASVAMARLSYLWIEKPFMVQAEQGQATVSPLRPCYA